MTNAAVALEPQGASEDTPKEEELGVFLCTMAILAWPISTMVVMYTLFVQEKDVRRASALLFALSAISAAMLWMSWTAAHTTWYVHALMHAPYIIGVLVLGFLVAVISGMREGSLGN